MHDYPDSHKLERLKRASLRDQSRRAAWQLGALARRVQREAPEVHGRLRSAVEALQLLAAQLGLELASDDTGVSEAAGSAASGDEIF